MQAMQHHWFCNFAVGLLLESVAQLLVQTSLLVSMLVWAVMEQLVPVILCLVLRQENVAQLVLIMLF